MHAQINLGVSRATKLVKVSLYNQSKSQLAPCPKFVKSILWNTVLRIKRVKQKFWANSWARNEKNDLLVAAAAKNFMQQSSRAALPIRQKLKQESLANAKGTRDSSACMKAHCPLGCSR